MSDSAGAALDLLHVVKRYGDARAVDDVTLSVEAGEFVTLLGPSGSGKTTTLNMIAGFIEPTDGEIYLDDEPITRFRPHKRNLGMVFQHYALFPHMRVFDNVAFPLKERRCSKAQIRTRVAEALDAVQLGPYADRLPRELSGGQQQRVALARALVYRPRALLMDEPLGALDKKLREHLQLEIKRMHRDLGITFIYVTHDQDEALVLSDRIAVFNEGRIEQIASPMELYDRPSTLFVAEFVGESNRLVGQIAERDNDRVTLVHDGQQYVGMAGHGVSTGDTAALVTRPERLRVTRERDVTCANAAQAVVRDVIYFGADFKVEVELPSGAVVTALERSGGAPPPRHGESVWLGWQVTDSVALPEGSAA